MRHTRLLCPVLVAIVSLASLSTATDNTKHAPSGFQGVRGKKSVEDTYPETALKDGNIVNSITSDIDKRAPSAGFHGMRGKKLVYPMSPLEAGYPSYPIYPAPEFMYAPKRAPMGFVGMRGKKEMEFVEDDLEQKRAPNMGFLGMRGKKYFDDEDERMYNEYFMEKRAPNMGFLGMRGKKEYSPLEEEKRAPSEGFFGMRGKKQPGRSSFFGMRGKKYPYEIRNKFVGVRGKKDSSENVLPDVDVMPGQDAYNSLSDLDLNELMFLLTDGSDGLTYEKRKGPSGFFGMRG